MSANKIKKPILLVHGEEDNNSGTLTTQEDTDDEAAGVYGLNDDDVGQMGDMRASVVMETLQLYKAALANDDQSTVVEIEAFLQSIEDEKYSLANKVAALSTELSTERDRVLRISADFDNFQEWTKKERLSLMTNVQGEFVESLLHVLDNFKRAKVLIKVETEVEEKINNSYQSIYKQFVEVLTSLDVKLLIPLALPLITFGSFIQCFERTWSPMPFGDSAL